jgi:hypothetical protein
VRRGRLGGQLRGGPVRVIVWLGVMVGMVGLAALSLSNLFHACAGTEMASKNPAWTAREMNILEI